MMRTRRDVVVRTVDLTHYCVRDRHFHHIVAAPKLGVLTLVLVSQRNRRPSTPGVAP